MVTSIRPVLPSIRRHATAAILAAVAFGAAPSRAADTPAKTAPPAALVTVAKVTNACFSDLVRVTGFAVPRKAAVVMAEQEGGKVSEVLVREGDIVSERQELVRFTAIDPRAPAPPPLRAPAGGLVYEIRTMVGAPASPQSGAMLRIATGNEIELDAEVPGLHLLKLNANATARVSRDNEKDIAGRVRLISPEINRTTQLGNVRIALGANAPLKIGMFARVTIDARRSCGVSVPRSALDHSTVQVVKAGNTIETRKVRVGLTSDTATEIIDGLAEGEIVVADAGTSLHDGDQVRTMFADELDRVRTR
jgi:multidrug efflux pump subunit AcrA (membrane-fusion protein)